MDICDMIIVFFQVGLLLRCCWLGNDCELLSKKNHGTDSLEKKEKQKSNLQFFLVSTRFGRYGGRKDLILYICFSLNVELTFTTTTTGMSSSSFYTHYVLHSPHGQPAPAIFASKEHITGHCHRPV